MANKISAQIQVTLLAIGLLGLSAPVHGQTGATAMPTLESPVFQQIDENGVDLLSGYFTISSPSISVGTETNGLSFALRWTGRGWQTNAPTLSSDEDGNLVVSHAGGRDEFTGNVSNIVQVKPNTGASLSCTLWGTYAISDSQGNYLRQAKNWISECNYESRQGVKITFSSKPPGFETEIRETPTGYNWRQSEIYGNLRTFPLSVNYPGQQQLQYDAPYIDSGAISVYSSNGYSVRMDGSYNSPIVKFNIYATVVVGTALPQPIQSLTLSTPNLVITNGNHHFIDPKSVTQTIEDSLGRKWSYTFNANKDMISVRKPGSLTDDVTITYDNKHRVETYTTAAGTWMYDYSTAAATTSDGPNITEVRNPTTLTNPNIPTNLTRVTYDKKKGQFRSLTDPGQRTTFRTYDSMGRLTSIAYPEGNKNLYEYDARGNVTKGTALPRPGLSPADPASIVTAAEFPADCVSRVVCNKPTATVAPNDFVDGVIPDDKKTKYEYNLYNGLPEKVTRPLPKTGAVRPQVRNTYTAHTAYVTNEAGTIVPISQVVPVFIQSAYLLTETSECRTTSSCDGTTDEARSAISYGPQDGTQVNNLLPVSATAAIGDGTKAATTTTIYDVVGNAVAVDGPIPGNQDKLKTRYDVVRQIVGTIGPDPDGPNLPVAVRTTYNTDGQVVLVETGNVATTADGDWSTFSARMRVATVYDSLGRPAAMATAGTGATLALTQTSYDVLSRPVCKAVRMNMATFPAIGAGGVLISDTATGQVLPSDVCAPAAQTDLDLKDRIERTIYDEVGQVTKIKRAVGTDFEQGYVAYAYDLDGKQTSVTDANLNLSTMEYDRYGRLNKWNFPARTGLKIPSATDSESYEYDSNGNRTKLVKRDGKILRFDYDRLDRLVKKFEDSSNTNRGPDVFYEYDNFGLQTIARFGNQSSDPGISAGYNALKQLIASTTTMSGAGRTLEFAYDVAGNRTRLTYPDGKYVSYEYDPLGRLEAIKDEGGLKLAGLTYDGRGRRAKLTLGSGVVTNYDYDDLGRLTMLGHDVVGSSTDVEWTFERNPASQIAATTMSKDAFAFTRHFNVDRLYEVNGLNQYRIATPQASTTPPALFTHSANGNLESQCEREPASEGCKSGTATFLSYNIENRLTSATGATTATLAYDPAGRLFQTSGGSAGITQFLYEGERLVGEYAANGTMLRRYVHGAETDEPLVWYEGSGMGAGERRYLLPNWQNSVVSVTDGVGNPLNVNSYDAYGIPGAGNLGRFQYTGQIRIPELDLYHYKSRLYSPTLGRFLQTDPVGYGDQINLYAYVGNDPVNNVDPDGMILAAVQAAIKTALNFVDKNILQAEGLNRSQLEAVAENAPISGTVVRMQRYDANPTRANAVSAAGRLALEVLAAPAIEFAAAKSLSLVGRAAAAESATASAARLGAEGEAAVGLFGPKVGVRIPGANNLRFPDNLTTTTLTEVKNVASQGLTNQLRDYITVSQSTGRTFDLYVRPSTRLTSNLEAAILRGDINLKYIPGAK